MQRRALFFAIPLILVLAILSQPNFVFVYLAAQNAAIQAEVYPPDSKPYGLSYEEWSIKWWQWLNQIPRGSNPLTDTTGKNCLVQQYGPVWFLAGSSGVKVERSCDIPEGKAIFYPIVNGEGSFAENPLIKSEEQLRSGLVEIMNEVTFIETTVDGSKLQNMNEHRVTSRLFNFSFPEDNDTGAPPGPTSGVSDGYWVMLHPLPVGAHEISFRGAIGDPTTTGSVNIIIDAKYQINVVPSNKNFQQMNKTILIDEEAIAFPINSSSTVSDFQFYQEERRISFKVSGTNNTEGISILPVGKLMNGPYTVMIDDNSAVFEIISDENSNATIMQISYMHPVRDVTVLGASIVPEFPTTLVFVILVLGIGIVLATTRKMFTSERN